MNPGKIAVIVLWILLASGFVVAPESGLAGVARAAFWFVAVAHAVEFAVFRRRFQGAPGSTAGHFFRTLVFGLFHIREFPQAQATPDGGSGP